MQLVVASAVAMAATMLASVCKAMRMPLRWFRNQVISLFIEFTRFQISEGADFRLMISDFRFGRRGFPSTLCRPRFDNHPDADKANQSGEDGEQIFYPPNPLNQRRSDSLLGFQSLEGTDFRFMISDFRFGRRGFPSTLCRPRFDNHPDADKANQSGEDGEQIFYPPNPLNQRRSDSLLGFQSSKGADFRFMISDFITHYSKI